jgi:hypothetical protein
LNLLWGSLSLLLYFTLHVLALMAIIMCIVLQMKTVTCCYTVVRNVKCLWNLMYAILVTFVWARAVGLVYL